MGIFLKRIFDLLVSLLAMILLLPVFAVIVIAIKLGSKGPVIFTQVRAGKNAEWTRLLVTQ
jgi:O-antigen biosynthesis protein WbqP